jgi:O-antigen ligase
MTSITNAAARPGEPGSASGLTAALAALVALGAAMGLGLVFGEVQALWVSLSVIGGLAVMYDFRIGALLLILLVPMSPATVFPHNLFGVTGLNPLNLLIGTTFLSFAIRARGEDFRHLLPKPLLFLFILPIVFAGANGTRHVDEIAPALFEALTIDFSDAGGYLRDLLFKPMLMVFSALLIGAAVAKSQKPERFLVPVGVSIFAICMLTLWYLRFHGGFVQDISGTDSRRFFSGLGFHANQLGRLLAVAYAMLLFAWAESRDKPFKLACVAVMALIVVSLVFTFSRGAFLGFVIVNGLFFLWRFNAKTMVIVIGAGLVLALLLPGQVYERITMGFSTGDWNQVSAGRIDDIWLPLLPEAFKSPIWGSGLGSIMWSDAMNDGRILTVAHPHNAFLEAFLDYGAVGMGLLLAFYWHVWKNLRNLGSNAFLTPEMRGFYQGTAAGMLAFLLTGFAGSSLAPLPETAFLWIAIGMMYGQLARRTTG